MKDLGIFPFGQKVRKVEQGDKTPKKVFVLGVYASAIHAKWLDAENKLLIRALAVASEPEIFWKGDLEDVEKTIKKIKLPIEAGKLLPADKNLNGPSGIALDKYYLKPLDLTRDDCWLCDLVPYSMINAKQIAAIERNKKIFERYDLQKETLDEATPGNRKIKAERIKEILAEIEQSQAKYLITLGNEPIEYFINNLSGIKYKLELKDKYGSFKEIKIDGKVIKWLPLVHPRQAAKLGGYSKDWYDRHTEWTKNSAKKLIK